jgi:hypothetical protein
MQRMIASKHGLPLCRAAHEIQHPHGEYVGARARVRAVNRPGFGRGTWGLYMRMIVVFGLACSTSACTTITVLHEAPTMQLTSTKSPDALEECISLAMSSISRPSTIRGDGHRNITFGNTSAIAMIATITYQTPNTVEIRAPGHIASKFRGRINNCM